MIVNRSDIINSVSKANNLNYSDIEFSIKKLIDFMSSNLYRGERIEIRGFGTFCLHTHRSRIARNPKTGEKIALERRNTVHFKPSKELKSRVNIISALYIFFLASLGFVEYFKISDSPGRNFKKFG